MFFDIAWTGRSETNITPTDEAKMGKDNAIHGHLTTAYAAGFTRIVPLIPVGASLYQGGFDQDGAYIHACDIDPNHMGKVPGVLYGDTWDTRSGWTNYQITNADITKYDTAGASCGLLGGDQWVGLDCDCLDLELAQAWFGALSQRYPEMQVRIGQYPKFLIVFRVTGTAIPAMRVEFYKGGVEDKQLIEIIGKGRQMVLLGDHPATNKPYQWYVGQDAAMPDSSRCEPLDHSEALELVGMLEDIAKGLGWSRGRSRRTGKGARNPLNDIPPDIDLARDFLAACPNTLDGEEWYKLAYALKWDFGVDGWPLFLDYSRKWAGGRDTDRTIERQWNACARPDGTLAFGGMMYHLADIHAANLPADLMQRVQADTVRRKFDLVGATGASPPGMTMPAALPLGMSATMPEQRAEMTWEVEGASVLDSALIARAAMFKVAGDERWGAMEDRARACRCLTEFKRKVNVHIKRQQMAELRAREIDRTWYNVSDPNTLMMVAEEIEKRAGENEMGFVFGGNAVVVKTQQSAFGRTIQRDPMGNKILDTDGEVRTEPAWVSTAVLLKSAQIRRIASKLGYFYHTNQEGVEQPCDIPTSLIQHIEAVAGETWQPMLGVTQHPVLWKGQLLFGDNEFHAPTGLFMQTGSLTVERWDDPVAAYKFLVSEWLGDFAFASDLDRAKAVMMPATMLVAKTDMMNQAGPPIFLDTAPFPGTGKSLKTSVCHAAITGSPAPASLYPERKEEREKVITATIMEGQTHLAFDNLRTGMTLGNSHAEVAAITTAPVYEGRILGVSKKFVGPAGLVITMNGNNVIPAGDMVSRVVEVRHEPPVNQNLAKRNFQHTDLMQWTLNNRAQIIGALACILSRPGDAEPNSRFPVWSRIVADPILKVAGAPGFYEPWIEAGEPDFASSGSQALGKLLKLMNRAKPHPNHWFTAHDIVKLVNGDGSLRLEVFGQTGPVDTKEVSAYMRRHNGYCVDGHRCVAKRSNLGLRTGHHERWCFWVG
jgi:hypothetical protein